MANYEHTHALLRIAVAKLPDDAKEIAAFLGEEGSSGHMGTCSACPLANWLGRELGSSAFHVHAGPEGIRAWYGPKATQFVVLQTPPAAAEFMRRFDQGLEIQLLCKDRGVYGSLHQTSDEVEDCSCGVF